MVTRAALVEHGACAEGLADFDAAYPGGVARVEWTRDACHTTLRGPLGRWLVWAWRRGLVPIYDLREANLSGADLRGANLSGAIGYSPPAPAAQP